MRYIYCLLVCCFVFACTNSDKSKYKKMVQGWTNRNILFPNNFIFSINGEDTVEFQFQNAQYKVLVYIDSVGCTSCKLKLPQWEKFMNKTKLLGKNIPFLFFIHSPNYHLVRRVIKEEKFNHPICYDEKDSLNILNQFLQDVNFQTFLLDKNNKVIAIGNPIFNPQIEELYLKIITGETNENHTHREKTEVTISHKKIFLTDFNWKKVQHTNLTLKNSGKHTLYIERIIPSCDCILASVSQDTIIAGEECTVDITYTAEREGTFHKDILIYCNTPDSPIKLRVEGNAK